MQPVVGQANRLRSRDGSQQKSNHPETLSTTKAQAQFESEKDTYEIQ